jgi:4-hydroxybenzoate polyprenyltransferase
VGVGVVLPLVGVVAQGAPIDVHTLTCLVPSFVLGVAGNVLTSIPDADADRAAGKESPAARWGVGRARAISIALHGLAVLIAMAFLPAAAGLAIPIALALQLVAARRSSLGFVVLGGATELAALLVWSAALAWG